MKLAMTNDGRIRLPAEIVPTPTSIHGKMLHAIIFPTSKRVILTPDFSIYAKANLQDIVSVESDGRVRLPKTISTALGKFKKLTAQKMKTKPCITITAK